MILCVNLNGAIDKTVVVSPFRIDEIHRPTQVVVIPGGKGCNVARALKTLGESPTIAGFVGGFAGQFIEAALADEGQRTIFVRTASESRTCLTIVDFDNHTSTEIYENGEPVTAEKVEEFTQLFTAIVGNYRMIALSGSLPPGVPPDFYRRLLEIAQAAGVPVALDASGSALKQGIVARPFLIKPNQEEFADLVGNNTNTLSDLVEAVIAVCQRYVTTVILSLGADGAIASNGSDTLHVRPPHIDMISAVGSGDALLAGVMYGLTHEFAFTDAVKYGVAAGTANALMIGAGVFTMADFQSVLSKITVTRF